MLLFFKHRGGSYHSRHRDSSREREIAPSIIIYYSIHLIANNHGAPCNNNGKAGRFEYVFTSCLTACGCVISDSIADIADHYVPYELFLAPLQFLSCKNIRRRSSYAKRILSFGTSRQPSIFIRRVLHKYILYKR